MTGSAPASPELVAWYHRLGLELLDIYGMTENFAVSHSSKPGQTRPGYVGTTLPGVEQRLTSEGEILIKSPGMMLGYFKAPDLTAEAIDKNGFLHTGDRGEIDQDGRLKITGRVKELFKTSKGKYVAPAPIENALLGCPFIEQACVTGASMGQPFAMVVLPEHLRKTARVAGQRSGLEQTLTAHLEQTNAKLDQHEQLEKLIVMSDEWTPDNGLLTPTLKLKRAAIEELYAPRVAGWYQQSARVIWA